MNAPTIRARCALCPFKVEGIHDVLVSDALHAHVHMLHRRPS